MGPVVLAVTLLLLAAALSWPARRFGERLWHTPVRPEYRTAAVINTVAVVGVFVVVILQHMGPEGILAAIAGAVVAAEVGILVSYMLMRMWGEPPQARRRSGR